MYSREQREAALEAYDRLGDVRAAVRELGYPSDTALAGWVRRRGEAPRPRKPAVRLDAHEKQGAVLRVLAGEEAARVAVMWQHLLEQIYERIRPASLNSTGLM